MCPLMPLNMFDTPVTGQYKPDGMLGRGSVNVPEAFAAVPARERLGFLLLAVHIFICDDNAVLQSLYGLHGSHEAQVDRDKMGLIIQPKGGCVRLVGVFYHIHR